MSKVNIFAKVNDGFNTIEKKIDAIDPNNIGGMLRTGNDVAKLSSGLSSTASLINGLSQTRKNIAVN